MLPWSFQSAGSLFFGRDSLQHLPTVYARLKAKRVLIVTDQNLVKAGIVAKVVEAGPGVTVSIFDRITPEPGLDVIREAILAAKEYQPDAIVGLGGGSNMDAAKLVAIIHAHGGDPWSRSSARLYSHHRRHR
jgi:alcohol dehydrogenase class IV